MATVAGLQPVAERQMVIWITGISGSGKTTLARALWDILKPDIPELAMLDGDVIRQAFANDLGHREIDRLTHIKRVQNIAKVLSDQKLTIIVSALYSSPELMDWNRQNIANYFEIYLNASMETVKSRDSKGLYSRAAAGEITDVVGVDIPWHTPENPDMVFDANQSQGVSEMAQQVVAAIPSLAKALNAK